MGPQEWGARGGPGAMGMADGGMGDMWLIMGLVAALALLGVVFVVLLLRRAVAGNPVPRLHREAVRRATARSAAEPPPSSGAPSGEVPAFLIIPDLSGYTAFMQFSRFSLGHAQYVVSALLDSIIDAASQCLVTAKVEGDAVLLYAVQPTGPGRVGVPGEHVGQAIVDMLRAFYRKRSELQAGNACSCEACCHIEKLELKTVVHGGVLLLYDLRGQQELSGLSVIVAHRLLKNSLDLDRYVLVSEEIHDRIPIPLDVSKARHAEHYEGLGEIPTVVYSFTPDALFDRDVEPAAAGLGAKAGDAARKLRENLRNLRP